jgi:Cu/Ag efflux protein CusF
MLDRLKEGDQIKFVVEQVDGAYIVTRVEATH